MFLSIPHQNVSNPTVEDTFMIEKGLSLQT